MTVQVVSGTMGLPTATVRLKGPDGQESIGIGMGTGPVDAAYKAIDSIVKQEVQCLAACPLVLCLQLFPQPTKTLQCIVWSWWLTLRPVLCMALLLWCSHACC